MTLSVAAVILTLNEELNLPACLKSLEGWCQRIFIVDSGSSDQTCDIARKAGATVLDHPFQNHASQWAWALNALPPDVEWTLGLDADQQVSPCLAQSIRAAFQNVNPSVDGFYVARRQVFQDRWIRHGGYYPKYLLKLFRRSKVVVDSYDITEHHFYILGPTQRLKGDLIEANQGDWNLSRWCEKHLRYATHAAEEEWGWRMRKRSWPIQPNLFGTPDQRTIWMKRLWTYLPLYWRSFLYFGYRYIFQLGFLDGPEGRRFHLLQGLWYRLLIDAHLALRLNQGSLGKNGRANSRNQRLPR